MFFKSSYRLFTLYAAEMLFIGLTHIVATVVAKTETRPTIARSTDSLACDDGLTASFRPDAPTWRRLSKCDLQA
ncbi:hypothetical protein G6L29_30980 [Agrobacterium rhizogenes]|uniref:Uncharacterized protein n=1 Tax=Rhizobium rhizogenes NBRC 13257 TaxID=1220581 RepID=A0AA87U796_RHIRH|nr:hypothetical protein [Rhizobium rhizogenes]NTF59294.1 hypothetical protein [Rhizobium rhizogenes]NTF78878.1 hypothetical protein [Rhizobium rhizogenes]NTF98096.1 hypothetical protein [Rhizobium rhizogenes]NTG64617.1 hypothetical protein [Rhizobium rhizogenes]NTG71200.1 hypothetical protein [Rhizobium rhizogenes]